MDDFKYHITKLKCLKSVFNFLERYANADLKISLYVCIHIKQYLENFAFLILKILKLFAPDVCKFHKK